MIPPRLNQVVYCTAVTQSTLLKLKACFSCRCLKRRAAKVSFLPWETSNVGATAAAAAACWLVVVAKHRFLVDFLWERVAIFLARKMRPQGFFKKKKITSMKSELHFSRLARPGYVAYVVLELERKMSAVMASQEPRVRLGKGKLITVIAACRFYCTHNADIGPVDQFIQ